MTRLPFPERVLLQHIATLGKTGAGKSSAMRVIAEHQLDKKRRVAIIDPKGDWWGLKSSADGKGAGYPVIAFGDFKEPRATDVPINEQSGKHVAELIATGNRPCVLGFRGWMPSQLTRFWLDFAPTLFNANQGELYIFIDEVHNFAPKGKILDPNAGKCLHWTNRIMSEGRGLGLTFYIASQRPQKVHNDTLDNCETLIAMRVTHPRSRDASEEWINARGDAKFAKEVLESLANLKRGEAWVWSPENEFGPERVQFPMFETFDSFAPPQVQKKVSTSGWADVDLDQVKQKLATVIAEAEANDPKKLKSEIARLRSELAKKSVAVPAAHVVPAKTIEVSVFTQEDKAELAFFRMGVSALHEEFVKLSGEWNKWRNAIAPIDQLMNSAMAKTQRPQPMRTSPAIPAHRPLPRAPYVAPHAALESNGDLSRLALQIAGILAAYYPQAMKRTLVAAMCGVQYGGHFSNNLSDLRTAELLDDPQQGMVRATAKCAKDYAGSFDPPATTQAVLELWRPKLSTLAVQIIHKLVEAGGEAMGRNDLAAALGVQYGGHFSNMLSELRGANLLVDVGKGLVAADKEALFLNTHAVA